MNWYWISYSLDGVNQGVINVESDSRIKALSKVRDKLGLEPKHDNVETCILIEGNELSPNVLISREEMINKNYQSIKELIPS